jgi:hypothetical protein
MGELVFIDVAKKARNVTVQEAWDAYVAAQDKAKDTRDIADGIAAGHAWRAWLELFVQKAS